MNQVKIINIEFSTMELCNDSCYTTIIFERISTKNIYTWWILGYGKLLQMSFRTLMQSPGKVVF